MGTEKVEGYEMWTNWQRKGGVKTAFTGPWSDHRIGWSTGKRATQNLGEKRT